MYHLEDFPKSDTDPTLRLGLTAEQIASKVQLHLEHGHFDLAVKALLSERSLFVGEVCGPNEALNAPLSLIGLDNRTVNGLEWAGLMTVQDVLAHTRAQLCSIPNVSSATVTRIVKKVRAWLASHNFAAGMNEAAA